MMPRDAAVKIAAITMVYNETVNLPIWLRYYGGQIGLENLVVVDHGSDDGSTADLGAAGRIRLPRDKFDDVQRGRMIAGLHASLLGYFDVVIYTDCDEMIVPDPAKYEGLADYCARLEGDAVTPVGLNVVHALDEEGPLDPARPILGQRRYGRFVSAMCKTLVSRVPIRWSGGFHGSTLPPRFDHDLYLFHLKRADLDTALARQQITRALDWASPKAGLHQRVSDDELVAHFRRSAADSRDDGRPFDFREQTAQYLSRVERIGDFHIARPEFVAPFLARIPDRFHGIV
jgi:hypothetical protein